MSIVTITAAVVAASFACASGLHGQSGGEARASIDSTKAFEHAADEYIGTTMDALPAVPGLAIVVVHDGAPVYLRGFGWADAEAAERMTAGSHVYIASNTKSFTALAAALLDEQGVLDLDAPVTRYLPQARFPPAVRADEVTLWNLLTHTSGMSNDAIVFRTAFSGEHTRSDLHRLLATTVENEDAPLGAFDYTNTGYNFMGMVLEAATGSEWQEVLRDHVFRPLGMGATSARRSTVPADAVLAAPYRATGLSERVRVGLEKTDRTLQSAGGIFSTSADLARWLVAQLEHGVIDESRRLPGDVLRETQRLHVAAEGSVGPLGRDGYGLGWIVGSYAGEQLLYHIGNFPGSASFLSFMPGRNLGVSVFVNEDVVGVPLTLLITAFVYDWWVNEGSAEGELDGFRSGLVSQLEQAEPLAPPATFAEDCIRALTGTYQSPEYGTLVVEKAAQGTLRFRIGEMRALVTSMDGNTVLVPLRPARPEAFTFIMEAGRAVRVEYGEWGSFSRVR